MGRTAKTLTIVVPLYNEAVNVRLLHNALQKIRPKLPVKTDLLFVDDGSQDNSVEVVQELKKQDRSIQLIELTRNFGKEIAITAGLHAVTADGALLIDADLQHPPRLIPQFVKRWQQGAEVVIGVRNGGEHSWFRNTSSNLFYAILNRISSTPIVPHETDYRLLDRRVIDEFNRFTERNRLSRGLIDWLGFKHEYIPFKVAERRHGQSYSRLKLLNLAFNSFVSHSLLPLRLAGYLGLIIMLTSGPLGVFLLFETYIYKDPWGLSVSGSATLAVLILFLIGIVLTCLGLIALYIANIHQEVTNRPMYVIRHHPKPRTRRK